MADISNVIITIGNKRISNSNNFHHLLYEVVNRISVSQSVKDTVQIPEGTYPDIKDPDTFSQYNSGFLESQKLYCSTNINSPKTVALTGRLYHDLVSLRWGNCKCNKTIKEPANEH